MRRRACLALPLSLSLAGAAALLPGAPARAQGSGIVERRLRFTLTFLNPHARVVERQRYHGYLAASLGERQRATLTGISIPHAVEQDRLGQRVVTLSFAELAPLARKVVNVTVGVAIDAAAPAPLREPRADWLRSERWIESDAAPIMALASSLRRADDFTTARAIYEWIGAHLEYAGYLADDHGALRALENRRGDCTEYATLAVALCRANGIPARMMGGYVCERDMAPGPAEYHNWAEVCLGGEWRLLDAQKGRFLSAPEQYVVWRVYQATPANAVMLAHRYRIDGEMVLGG